MQESRSVSLVLSGGGARGLAHIGVIHELEDRGYQIRSITGCSIGALIGGLYAVGMLDAYERWVVELDKLDILKMIDFTLIDKGFIKGERVFEQMRKLNLIPEVNIEDLSIPFAAVAVDILHNRETVFRSGNLEKAIRASIAIPLVFTPLYWNDEILVDGGVLNPLPLEHAFRTPGDLLVAIDLNAPIPYIPPVSIEKSGTIHRFVSKIEDRAEEFGISARRLKNLVKKWDEFFGLEKKERKIGTFELVMRSVQLMQNKLTSYALEKNPPDVLIPISKDCATVFEFYRAEELIQYGREACVAALEHKQYAQE